MEVSEIDKTEVQAPARDAGAEHEQCENCGTPVERAQRYCVECGARRRHVNDPAARFLGSAGAGSRRQTRAAPAAKRHSSGLGLALLLAVIPLAVGLGVLVGRASNNGDGKLIAALRAQKPQVITTGATATGATATGGPATAAAGPSATRVGTLKSTFPLQSGYAVEIQALARKATTASAVAAAESAARAKGATQVGLILQSDFRVIPTPPNGDEVIYSGAYHSQADADSALARLKAKFPGAKVISVKSASLATGAPKVLARTSFGTAHQITGYKPTKAQLAQGREIAQSVARKIGKSYVGAQKGLPDQISVP